MRSDRTEQSTDDRGHPPGLRLQAAQELATSSASTHEAQRTMNMAIEILMYVAWTVEDFTRRGKRFEHLRNLLRIVRFIKIFVISVTFLDNLV